jgi:UDP-N-acetylmuramate dehydrogenase
MSGVVKFVRAVERGAYREFLRDELDFSYRHSVFSGADALILSAEIELISGERGDIEAKMRELAERRRTSQPLDLPSAGSAFKRPASGYAARMIDEAGLRGYAIGGAQVSEKHAGFIVNRGNATCDDVLRLLDYVRESVYRRTGITLEPEIKIIGAHA